MLKIEILAQLVHEILKNYYFDTLWACLGMSSQRPTQNENFPNMESKLESSAESIDICSFY